MTFGYSGDKRPDKRQVNIGVSATDDGEVVLPGGSSIHSGDTNDGTTTVPTHERLHEIFQRSDLLVTGRSNCARTGRIALEVGFSQLFTWCSDCPRQAPFSRRAKWRCLPSFSRHFTALCSTDWQLQSSTIQSSSMPVPEICERHLLKE